MVEPDGTEAGGGEDIGVDVVLADARALGMLGPAAVRDHRHHAEGLAAALRPATAILDLGSGGGVPGLLVALAQPSARVVLLDAREARTDFLARAVRRLGWNERVEVVSGRAEQRAHDARWRHRFGAVIARGFGPPATTAECAAGFLAVGGQLVVSDPPDGSHGPDRWPAKSLAQLGLEQDERTSGAIPLSSFTAVRPCPARTPRRSLKPPLW